MTEPVQIRRAEESDTDAVLAVLQASFEPYRMSYTEGAYRDTVPTREGMQQRIEAMSVLVATTPAGEIIGTVSYSTTGREGHLRGFAVLPEYLGAGTAAQLLLTAERELRTLGCAVITLDTTAPLQRAIRFYTKHGYVPSGTVTDFHGMPLFEYRKAIAGERK